VSVIIGPYKKKSQKIDGLDFNLYLHPGHDYFSKYLEEINDTIPGIIAESLKDFERTVDCYYPFARFTLVEVPVQFYSYERILIGERDQIQPEMVFFPEKGVTVRDADFAGSEKRMARWGRGDFANMTAKDKKVTLLQNFLSNFTQSSGRPNFSRSAGQVQVTEKKNPTFVFPLFYNYAYITSNRINGRLPTAFLNRTKKKRHRTSEWVSCVRCRGPRKMKRRTWLWSIIVSPNC
jgi:hypothetical protein